MKGLRNEMRSLPLQLLRNLCAHSLGKHQAPPQEVPRTFVAGFNAFLIALAGWQLSPGRHSSDPSPDR